MKAEPRRSWLALRFLQAVAFVSLLVLAGSLRASRDGRGAGFLRDTSRGWCTAHAGRTDLQVVSIEVTYRPEPPLFTQGEGTVVAPVALDLPGAQRVLEVASHPPHLRKLTTPGITALAWEYGGRLHRGLRFHALALVERPARHAVTLPGAPSFDRLPADLRPESLAKAVDLEEHGLEKCAAFPGWAVKAAGTPPYTLQIERLVQAVSRRSDDKTAAEDVCAALRDGRFKPHWAQVAVVMGARELGIPAFGFAPASDARTYLVGTYVDGPGWVLLDVERPSDGWFTGGPPLVTMAPLLAGFAASQHAFWSPEAGAYAYSGWGVQTISATAWQGEVTPGKRTDTTAARSMPLAEACR